MSILNHLRELSTGGKPRLSAAVVPSPPSVATEIPEILNEIFSYLSQHDLQHRARAVNKLWRSISENLIQGEAHWQDTLSVKEQERVLSRLELSQVKTLHCFAQDKRTYPAFPDGIEKEVEDAWVRFERRIISLAETKGRDIVDHHGTKEVLLPWRALVFSGMNCFNERWDPLIRRCHGFLDLKSLRLEHLTPGTVDLGCIFEKLPNLEELAVESHESLPFTYKRNATITWKDREREVRRRQEEDEEEEGKQEGKAQRERQPLRVLKLQKLVLRQLIVSQRVLETVVGAMPHLRSFELKYMISNIKRAEALIERRCFITYLAKTCLNLDSFQFSISGCPLTLLEAQHVHAAFPRLRSLSLPGRDIIPGALDLYTDRLTALEIECYDHSRNQNLGAMLHAYLCQASLLLHLKAYRLRYWYENLILRLLTSSSSSWPQLEHIPVWAASQASGIFDKPVWACRNLRTLHVMFEFHGLQLAEVEARPAISRTIFGYISRVCPRLEDIAVQRRHLDINVRSGLLLLSRCKELKKLRIYNDMQQESKEYDLEWMALGMNESGRKKSSQQSSFFGEFMDSLYGRLQMSNGVFGGASKSAREARVQITIKKLKDVLFRPQNPTAATNAAIQVSDNQMPMPEQSPAPSLITTESPLAVEQYGMRDDRDTDEGQSDELDPSEMTTLSSMRHVIRQLEALLYMSKGTPRDEDRICCWPKLEVLEIYEMIYWAVPVRQCQDLITKLRPDLEK
ncbi:hypothetical protein EDD21DRAFT_411855 [Dissophora ornata]|nr:hypothetical protein BGZ58_005227 [Dissophora ornata]KAI8604678.1 hypothetical protein EDD21DRAFT_411855 [Dissophora ornata]